MVRARALDYNLQGNFVTAFQLDTSDLCLKIATPPKGALCPVAEGPTGKRMQQIDQL